MPLVNIDDIEVTDRFRRDLGDVSQLAASIVSVGLLNPVTVSADMKLIAGERRIAAHRLLGLAEIEVRVAETISDARDFLVAERDENTQRKEMLPSEAAALGMAIEQLEKPAALERRAHGQTAPGRNAPGPGTTSVEGLRTRDIAAEAVGLSEPTYRRIKQAIETADDESMPEPVREVAREVVKNIDAGEPIRREVERIREAKEAAGVTLQRHAQPEPRKPNTRSGTKRKHADMLDALLHTLDGASVALDDIDYLDQSITKNEATRLADGLAKQIRSLNRIKRLLEGIN